MASGSGPWIHVSQKIVSNCIRLRIRRKETMVNFCSVYKCYSNKAGHPAKAAFKLPKDLEQKKSGSNFLNRKDLSEDMKYIYYYRNENHVRLINAKNPVPALVPNRIEKKSVLLI